MIYWINSSDQPVRNNIITYKKINSISAGERDDYTSGCLLKYSHFLN